MSPADRRAVAALAALAAGHLAVNLVWLAQTTSVDIGLPHNHLYQALAQALDLSGARTWGNPHSVVYALSSFFVALFGPSYGSLTVVHSAFFVATLGAVYLLGRDLAGPWAGFAAAALASLTPGLYGAARLYSDLPLGTAVTAWALWLLWRSGGLARPWPLVALAALLVAGLSQLFVPSNAALIALALVGPALVALLAKPPTDDTSSRLRRFALAGLTLLAVLAGLAVVAPDLLSPGYYAQESARFGDASLALHPHYAITQLVLLGGYVVRPVLFAALLLGAALLLRRRDDGRWFLLLAVLVPLLVLTIVPKRKDLNLFPLLPAIAVLTAVGLAKWKHGRIALTALLVVAVAQFGWNSFTPRTVPRAIAWLGLDDALEAPPYPWTTAPQADPPQHQLAVAVVAHAGGQDVLSLGCATDDTLRFELALLDRRIRLRQRCEESAAAAALDDATLLVIPQGEATPAGFVEVWGGPLYSLAERVNVD